MYADWKSQCVHMYNLFPDTITACMYWRGESKIQNKWLKILQTTQKKIGLLMPLFTFHFLDYVKMVIYVEIVCSSKGTCTALESNVLAMINLDEKDKNNF